MLIALDDHALQQIAQARLDGAFEAGGHVEIVGNGPRVRDRTGRVGENQSWRIVVAGARGVQLFQGFEPSGHRGQLLLSHPTFSTPPVELDPSTGQFGVAIRARTASRFQRLLGALCGIGRGLPPRHQIRRLDPRIRRFGLQPCELLHHAGSSGHRILHHIPQRGRCVDRGKYLAASRLDVPFQPFNRRMGRPIGGLRISKGPHGAVPFSITVAGRSALGLELDVRRFAAGFQLFQFSLEIGGRRRERRDLLRIEVQLLLPAADVELASVRGLARRGGP